LYAESDHLAAFRSDFPGITAGPTFALLSTAMPSLQFELAARKLRFLSQHAIPIVYKGIRLDATCRIDLIVEDVVVVEVKAVEAVLPVHDAQLSTYMRLTGCRT
jgi:GxxExxY protein